MRLFSEQDNTMLSVIWEEPGHVNRIRKEGLNVHWSAISVSWLMRVEEQSWQSHSGLYVMNTFTSVLGYIIISFSHYSSARDEKRTVARKVQIRELSELFV